MSCYSQKMAIVSWPETHRTHTYIHTHTRLTAVFPGLPGWAGTRKVKPIWILLKQETVSGSGISWAVCKSAPLLQPMYKHKNLVKIGCVVPETYSWTERYIQTDRHHSNTLPCYSCLGCPLSATVPFPWPRRECGTVCQISSRRQHRCPCKILIYLRLILSGVIAVVLTLCHLNHIRLLTN